MNQNGNGNGNGNGGEAEIKTCELCGRLFVRQAHPVWFNPTLGRWLDARKQTICIGCFAHPPKEHEEEIVAVYSRSYRVTVRF